MKKLSLLILLLSMAVMAQAQFPESELYGESHLMYHRLDRGSAIVDYTSPVPQEGVFEMIVTSIQIDTIEEAPVYIKNIVYGSQKTFGDYWVEGYLMNNKLYVPLNQVIAVEYTNGTRGYRAAMLAWGNATYDAATGHSRFNRDTSVQVAVYNLDNNTILIENTSGPVVIDAGDDLTFNCCGLGIVWTEEDSDECEWAGYCEWSTEISTGTYVIDQQPEGELKTYNRTSDCFVNYDYGMTRAGEPIYFNYEPLSDKGEIVFGNDGVTVYLKDPLLSMKNGTWIMGSLRDEGKTIRVNLTQYLTNSSAPIQLTSGESEIRTSVRADGTYGDWLGIGSSYDYNYIYYMIDGDRITLLNTWTTLDLPYPNNYNAGGLVAYDLVKHTHVLEANIVYTLDSETPVEKTDNPIISGYAMENGEVYCVEIKPSEPSTIYYRVHLPDGAVTSWTRYNDQPLTFDVPGDYRIEAYAQATGKSSSDVIEHTFKVSSHTGVSEIATGKKIVAQRYFNAMGQQVQHPAGVTIIVTTYSDGSTTAVKIMK